MVATDLLEIRVLVERPHRVATEKRKRLRICQLIPERFKADSRLQRTSTIWPYIRTVQFGRPSHAVLMTSHMLFVNARFRKTEQHDAEQPVEGRHRSFEFSNR